MESKLESKTKSLDDNSKIMSRLDMLPQAYALAMARGVGYEINPNLNGLSKTFAEEAEKYRPNSQEVYKEIREYYPHQKITIDDVVDFINEVQVSIEGEKNIVITHKDYDTTLAKYVLN